MRLLHTAAKTHATFDDPNLVSHAGLVPAARLSENVGLEALVAEYVHVAAKVGANLAVTGLLVNVAAGAVPEGVSALARPPPLRVAVLPLRLLLVSVTAPRFRIPPPLPTALPLVSATAVVRVRLPVAATSAIRNGSREARVMVAGPIMAIGVVITGSPVVSPPCGEVNA
jgi:hypothetical protein